MTSKKLKAKQVSSVRGQKQVSGVRGQVSEPGTGHPTPDTYRPDTYRTKWTPKKAEKFLATLAKWGNVRLAAEAVALSRSRAYELRDEDEAFAAAWDAAVEEAADRLEQEAWRRAVDGWEEPVFGSLGSGEGSGEVGTIRRYSNALLIFLLKGSKPEKYVERVKAEHSGNLTLEVVNYAGADLEGKQRITKDGKERHDG